MALFLILKQYEDSGTELEEMNDVKPKVLRDFFFFFIIHVIVFKAITYLKKIFCRKKYIFYSFVV